MKTLKIVLVIAIVVAIVFFVIRSLDIVDPPVIVSKSKNQYIQRIEQEIKSLGNFSDNKFCKEFYNEVGFHIDDNYKDNRFSTISHENDQWKENLTKNLYTAYANKFVKQAFYVFNSSQWEISDLNFIRSEYQALRSSNLLERGSDVDRKFTEIQNILTKYDEISGFVSNNKGFSYSGIGLSERFPASDVAGGIAKAKAYLDNNLGNQYVNKCIRLREGLKSVPQSLFNAHVRYLDAKVNEWSGMYSNFNSQRAYTDNLYRPLKSEIDALRNNIYSGSNVNGVHNRLMKKLDSDSQNAYNHFNVNIDGTN